MFCAKQWLCQINQNDLLFAHLVEQKTKNSVIVAFLSMHFQVLMILPVYSELRFCWNVCTTNFWLPTTIAWKFPVQQHGLISQKVLPPALERVNYNNKPLIPQHLPNNYLRWTIFQKHLCFYMYRIHHHGIWSWLLFLRRQNMLSEWKMGRVCRYQS